MPDPNPAVEPNPEVILFEHPGFRGAHRHVFQREDDLSFTSKREKAGVNVAGGNFAGVTSSIIVVRGTWLFFADTNCKGHREQLPPKGELPPKKYFNLKETELKDDVILSLRPKKADDSDD